MSSPHDTTDQKAAEQAKTREQRGEDIAYTLNHAISCGMTDVFTAPLIAATWHATTGKEAPLILQGCLGGEGHDHAGHDHHHHGHDHHHHGHDHHHHGHDHHAHADTAPKKNWFGRVKQRFNAKSFGHHLKEYAKGEILGDVIAVPLTIGVQRLFPGFMHSMRKGMEPLVEGVFRHGAHNAAQEMAKKKGLNADAPEVKAHEQAIYEHEVSHLPQAVVWNMFAFPISVVAQCISTMFNNKKAGVATNWKKSAIEIVLVKTGGSIISNGVLIGGRMLAPEHANKMDRWQSKNIIVPATKVVGGFFGVDEKTVDRIAEKEERLRGDDWKERVKTPPPASTEPQVG